MPRTHIRQTHTQPICHRLMTVIYITPTHTCVTTNTYMCDPIQNIFSFTTSSIVTSECIYTCEDIFIRVCAYTFVYTCIYSREFFCRRFPTPPARFTSTYIYTFMCTLSTLSLYTYVVLQCVAVRCSVCIYSCIYVYTYIFV